jgi:hypothetical protein
VAVGDDNSTAYSTDGIHWTEKKILNQSVDWKSITYGLDNDVFGFL